MSLDLSVKPLRVTTLQDLTKKVPYSKSGILPEHPGRILFIAPSQSGKSRFIISLLTQQNLLRGFYQKVYIVSPTAEADSQFDVLKDAYPREGSLEFIEDFDPEQIMGIMQDHIDLVKINPKKAPRTLLLLDDCAGAKGLELISPLFMKCRHGSMSVWISSQAYTAVPLKQRLQASNVFIWSAAPSEVEKFAQEYQTVAVNKHRFCKLLADATKERYNSFYIDKQHDSKYMFRHGLTDYYMV